MPRIVAIGDNDVDCYASTGLMYPGGNCYNVSVLARRFGARSAYVGAMADDPAGRHMRRVLAAEGVETDRLRVVDGLTAYCVIGHRDGDREFLTYDLGVSRFAPDDADIAYLAGFDAAHVGRSSGLDGWLGAIAAQTALSYDFAVQHEADHIRAVAPLCWLAAVSTSELDKADALALARTIHAADARWVLATRGRQGAILVGEDGEREVAAHPVEATDTLGAGDTFIARTLVGLLRGEDPAATLAEAAKAAAATCTYFGAVGHGVPIDLPVAVESLHEAFRRRGTAAGE